MSCLSAISDYARSWSLLQGYDEQQLTEISTHQTGMQPLDLDSALTAIADLKRVLIAKGEATELFGQLRGDGWPRPGYHRTRIWYELFYPNIASRAAHLLYLSSKTIHWQTATSAVVPFCLWYLRLNQQHLAKPVEQLINDNTLVALALLVAESLPEQRTDDRLVQHFVLLKS